MLSFVIPTRNNEMTVLEVFQQISNQCGQIEEEFEVIFLDSSTDNTWQKLLHLVSLEPARVRAIQLRQGVPKSAAYHLGFQKAIGDIIFTLSASLKDDPVAIPKFLRELEQGNDLVIGHKKQRKLSTFSPARMLNKLASYFSGIDLNHYNSDFVCYRAEVIRLMTEQENVNLQKNHPLSASIEGYKVGEIFLKERRWYSGNNRYNLLEFSSLYFLKYHPGRPQKLISYVIAGLFFTGISLILLDFSLVQGQSLSIIGFCLMFNIIPLAAVGIVMDMQNALLSYPRNQSGVYDGLVCYDSAESLKLIKTDSQIDTTNETNSKV